MCGDGVEHMNTRQNIRGCVSPVKEADHFDKNIVPFKFQRAKQVSVGINGGHDQKNGHAGI